MSEYWKSTPKYWCKHCSCYVRDTKLERQNHDATAKHQGALKRFLRNLHRGHEREEREKERAQREIARLNGVVGGPSSSSSAPPPLGSGARHGTQPKPAAGEPQLKAQREQLAALGVSMPSSFRPEMTMPGEWTVTSTTTVMAGNDGQQRQGTAEARAAGVRKREETEEQKEEEAAVRSLFKKPRRWGRDSKTMPQEEEDTELDALLSGTMSLGQAADEKADIVKKEEEGGGEAAAPEGDGKKEGTVAIKEEEPDTEPQGLPRPGTTRASEAPGTESRAKAGGGDARGVGVGVGAVVFKKRKPKGIRPTR